MNVTRARKASALLIVVSSIVGLQLAVLSMHPITSNFVAIAQNSGQDKSLRTFNSTAFSSVFSVVSSVVESSSQGQPATSQAATTQTQPPPPTTPPSTQTVTTVITLLQPQVTATQDYTPIGIAIVAAVGIIVLVIMFLKRKR